MSDLPQMITDYLNAPTAWERLGDDMSGLAEPAADGYWDDGIDEPHDFGNCDDCGCRMQSGQEARDGLCHSCVRERAGR